jgi:hypothetical protein
MNPSVHARGARFRCVIDILVLFASSLAGSACGAGETPSASAAAASSAVRSTRDVRDFIARREQCDHFRGEEANDPKRQAMLDAKLKAFCTGTDAQLAALKKKYGANKPVQKALSRFDANIE